MQKQEGKDKYRNMSIREALEIVDYMGGSGTRDELIGCIGETMLETLNVLGYITHGATLDDDGFRRPVWQLTSKPNLYKEMNKPLSREDAKIGRALVQIGF